MNARERFAADISAATDHWNLPIIGSDAEQIAVELEEKGYSKPRTITTVEELYELPVDCVIYGGNGEVFQKQANAPWCDGPHEWQSFEGTYWNGETFVFPATVIHEGDAA